MNLRVRRDKATCSNLVANCFITFLGVSELEIWPVLPQFCVTYSLLELAV